MDQAKPLWNSLEIVKLVVSALTPIIIIAIGFWITRLTERFKSAMWANQKVIEKRIAVYDEIAPMLNDLYCYYNFVGNWKELTPVQLVEIKRRLDKKVYIYAALFSPAFIQLYFRFIHLCFETYVGPGQDARLRTYIADQTDDRRKALASPAKWDDSWDKMFSEPSEVSSTQEIRDAYGELMSCFSRELGVGIK